FLFRDHRVDSGCAGAIREYLICRFPPPVSGGRGKRISTIPFQATRKAAGLLLRYLCVGVPRRLAADYFPRDHGPAHSVVCRGSVSRFHALPGRDGDALEE